ncbi:MAG: hypothetical protein ACLS8Q_00680 [Anaerovoracaceae bacterium]
MSFKQEINKQEKEILDHLMTYGGLLDTTPCTLEGRSFIEQKCDSYATCLDCRKDYWLKEVEE